MKITFDLVDLLISFVSVWSAGMICSGQCLTRSQSAGLQLWSCFMWRLLLMLNLKHSPISILSFQKGFKRMLWLSLLAALAWAWSSVSMATSGKPSPSPFLLTGKYAVHWLISILKWSWQFAQDDRSDFWCRILVLRTVLWASLVGFRLKCYTFCVWFLRIEISKVYSIETISGA